MSYLTEVRGLKYLDARRRSCRWVVPHGGTWIEIHYRRYCGGRCSSYLTEVRGLKSLPAFPAHRDRVVPHGGTWIEIFFLVGCCGFWVVPHGGTWIEIYDKNGKLMSSTSYLTEVRGLK